ncbi:helix-turn-helix domain-containing protein [Sphingobium boeckii]|uniref:Transcriptional regulator with XRE-family HTH domain n=1 Tax=Sphingobium boeckii TaxID=1082345 RepID=A0A7W9AG37_9SPHN|nr:helix-turn-helix transcriptional regulator [Sphingobium boeckii]MBB5684989.1 transcriptional regulator with XRE-family HTH domain [Sphingobium boeckii]
MSSAKTRSILIRLGKDLRAARLRRGMAIVDLAVGAGTSTSTIIRLEKGEAGVGIGMLADVLVVFGLNERLPI